MLGSSRIARSAGIELAFDGRTMEDRAEAIAHVAHPRPRSPFPMICPRDRLETMPSHTSWMRTAVATALVAVAASLPAQSTDVSSAMHWRSIGPIRAGRARALAGVPSQPNVFYAGFDNGGVWRSTDYGSTWLPLFDEQPTGSIGAIAV